MASSTRQSLLALQEKLNSQSGVNLDLAKEFFAIANALQQSAQLRSLLSDPSAESSAKEKVVDSVFAAASSQAKETAKLAAKLRWSSTRDLAAALEVIGVRAIASQSKNLDSLQTELFEIQQLVAKDSELELALSTTRVSPAGKQELVGKLLRGKVSEAAWLLPLRLFSQGPSSASLRSLNSMDFGLQNLLASPSHASELQGRCLASSLRD